MQLKSIIFSKLHCKLFADSFVHSCSKCTKLGWSRQTASMKCRNLSKQPPCHNPARREATFSWKILFCPNLAAAVQSWSCRRLNQAGGCSIFAIFQIYLVYWYIWYMSQSSRGLQYIWYCVFLQLGIINWSEPWGRGRAEGGNDRARSGFPPLGPPPPKS